MYENGTLVHISDVYVLNYAYHFTGSRGEHPSHHRQQEDNPMHHVSLNEMLLDTRNKQNPSLKSSPAFTLYVCLCDCTLESTDERSLGCPNFLKIAF